MLLFPAYNMAQIGGYGFSTVELVQLEGLVCVASAGLSVEPLQWLFVSTYRFVVSGYTIIFVLLAVKLNILVTN